MSQGTVSPDVVVRQMARVAAVSDELSRFARVVAETYEELFDYGRRQTSRGDVSTGRRGGRDSDPTGDVVASGMHSRLRSQANRAASKVRSIQRRLEEAEAIIVEAFAETDPEMREKLMRLRELEREMEAAGDR